MNTTPTFTHLHVHSEYSVQDGLAKIPALVVQSLCSGMHALAITDHGYMGGIPELFRTCRGSDALKPIAGCEIYCEDKYYHLVLLAKNEQGYYNLCRLVSAGFTAGRRKPCVPFAAIEKYHEGLICCSACIGGEIAQHILHGNIADAKAALFRLKQVFRDDFYIEIQRSKTDKPGASKTVYQLQQKANPVLVKLAEQYGVKVIATNDPHFLYEGQAEAHDHLLCMQFGAKWADEKRLRFSQQEWLKTPAEMATLFRDMPEVLSNTQEIVDKIERYDIFHKPMLPTFEMSHSYTDADEYLGALVVDGALKRYGRPVDDDVADRIEAELEHIRCGHSAWYFLVWWDIVRAARERKIWMSPGRGGAGWSIVCYCLGITDIDPMHFHPRYEHFYPSEEGKLPHIEVAFEPAGISDLVEYIRDKYGDGCVARMTQYNRLDTESATKRLHACHEGIDPAHAAEIARQLNGTIYSMDMQPCSLVIAPRPVADLVPLAFPDRRFMSIDRRGMPVTQYDKRALEYVGLVWFDIVSQKSLSVLRGATAVVRDKHGVDIDLLRLPMDDGRTLQLLCDGDTEGISRLDNDRWRACLRDAKPQTFEDLVWLYAVCRAMPDQWTEIYAKKQAGNPPLETSVFKKFPKSHAICDMFCAYQCAYLKAHYRDEYMQVYAFYRVPDTLPDWYHPYLLAKPHLIREDSPLKDYWRFREYLRSITR